MGWAISRHSGPAAGAEQDAGEGFSQALVPVLVVLLARGAPDPKSSRQLVRPSSLVGTGARGGRGLL